MSGRTMSAVLARAGVPLYLSLLSEYGLDDFDTAYALGHDALHAQLIELLVDPPHANTICTSVFDDTNQVNQDGQQCEVDVTLWTHDECLVWLDGEIEKETSINTSSTNTTQSHLTLFTRVANALREPDNNYINGDILLSMLSSVREMRDVLGLNIVSERQCFERRLLERTGLRGSLGALYNPDFLRAVQPLWSFHMGAENMAPMLYNLVRFVKPSQVLEIGAGYTSAFLVQALHDNAVELGVCAAMQDRGFTVGDHKVPYFVEGVRETLVGKAECAKLHCVDNLAHQETTAHKLLQVSRVLGVEKYLELHVADGWEFASEMDDEQIDMMWVDFGAGDKLDDFFEKYWPKLSSQGGFILVHSTLTNRMTRLWTENMRMRANAETKDGLHHHDEALGEFATLSLYEPHKMFQNSFSIFQKRGPDFAEPLWSGLP